MSDAIVRTGKRGRPAVGAKSIHLTLPPDLLMALDAWISEQDDALSRPEAIRLLIRERLLG